MKKLLLLFVMMLLPMVASADESGICGDHLIWTYSEDTKTLNISGYGAMYNYYMKTDGSYVSPTTPWKDIRNKILFIVIESGVTSVGSYAFFSCYSVISISIPNSVKTCGERAFSCCVSLKTINLPNGVTSIGMYAFESCTSLISITIPSSLTIIDSDAFNNCNSLNKVCISDLYSWINITFNTNPLYNAHHLYLNEEEITNLIIPDGVISIGKNAFGGCTGITTVTIPNSLTSIGTNAFKGCDGLSSIYISELETWLRINFDNADANPLYHAHHLYLNEEEISTLIIPENISSVGRYSFAGCTGLSDLSIGNGVATIDDCAFVDCTGLTSVIMPNCVSFIGASAFEGCSNIRTIVLPEDLKTINWGTFEGCSSMKEIVIPSKVEILFQNAFAGCNSLERVKLEARTPPLAYDNSFSNYNTDLLVPEESISLYKSTSPWNRFQTIKPLNVDDVAQISTRPVFIKTDKGFITLEGIDDGTQISIYGIDGVQKGATVSENGAATINTPLQSGSVAIIKIGEKSVKIIVK